MRISRDQMFMEIARIVSKRSTCLRSQVGAVLVKNNRIVSIGYAGSPPGAPHCDPSTCNKDTPGGCKNTIHAEKNAIDFAQKEGISTEGATIYITMSPCKACAEEILKAGIKRVVYDRLYRDSSGIQLLDDHSVAVELFWG